MDDETKTAIENVRIADKEVCLHHGAVTDFRGKLLTLLPLASGAGIYLLIQKQSDPIKDGRYRLSLSALKGNSGDTINYRCGIPITAMTGSLAQRRESA